MLLADFGATEDAIAGLGDLFESVLEKAFGSMHLTEEERAASMARARLMQLPSEEDIPDDIEGFLNNLSEYDPDNFQEVMYMKVAIARRATRRLERMKTDIQMLKRNQQGRLRKGRGKGKRQRRLRKGKGNGNGNGNGTRAIATVALAPLVAPGHHAALVASASPSTDAPPPLPAPLAAPEPCARLASGASGVWRVERVSGRTAPC